MDVCQGDAGWLHGTTAERPEHVCTARARGDQQRPKLSPGTSYLHVAVIC